MLWTYQACSELALVSDGTCDAAVPDKAIDLVDEACANVRVQLDSVPEDIDVLRRQKYRLEVEEKAISKEKDKVCLPLQKTCRFSQSYMPAQIAASFPDYPFSRCGSLCRATEAEEHAHVLCSCHVSIANQKWRS